MLRGIYRRSPIPMGGHRLYTPGPLTTSAAVKKAASKDVGSRDPLFKATISSIRHRLLDAVGVSKQMDYHCVLIPGSGTYAVESMLSSVVPRNGKVLVANNGSYCQRQVDMCERLGIAVQDLQFNGDEAVDPVRVADALCDPSITHLSFVHHETTAGILNPVGDIVKVARSRRPDVKVCVDAMSAFGIYDLQMSWGVDFAVASMNKGIEGIPGCGFVLCHGPSLLASEGGARSVSLDLHAQWRFLDSRGECRFTPPCQTLLAFEQALDEWDAEGKCAGRRARYQENSAIIVEGLLALGFKCYVSDPSIRGCVITAFVGPDSGSWSFDVFYEMMADQGFMMYASAVGGSKAFRVGNIGQLFPQDCTEFIAAARRVMAQLGSD